MTRGHDFGPAFTRSFPGQPCVIPALLGVCGMARRGKNVEVSAIVKRLPFPVNEREIENWEAGESAPPSGRLDVIVATYAALTGNRTEHVWEMAIYQAKRHQSVAGRTTNGVSLSVRLDGTGFETH
ncbi:MAG: hypothetical protein J0H98_08215 [Solirubrobacterales bacterium]|nr:hypothetical protein [Solirubrobacterales bacterium]